MTDISFRGYHKSASGDERRRTKVRPHPSCHLFGRMKWRGGREGGSFLIWNKTRSKKANGKYMGGTGVASGENERWKQLRGSLFQKGIRSVDGELLLPASRPQIHLIWQPARWTASQCSLWHISTSTASWRPARNALQAFFHHQFL